MIRAIVLAVVLAAPAYAAEQPVSLKPGPAAALTAQACGGCHSLDYIAMNSPFLSADIWKAEVAKMRTAFGASIDDADAAAIAAYLATAYGAAPH